MSALAKNMIELRVPSKPEYVSIVRALVTDLARKVALSSSAVEDVRVAVSEACANVVRHAYADPGSAEIVIRCGISNARLIMEVADSGHGFTEQSVGHSRSPGKDGGFGLMLMRSLMDQVSLDSSPEHGTLVRMVKGTRRRSAQA